MSSITVEVPQIQYIDRVMDDSSCAWKTATSAGDLTANNDHAVAEYHTVMLEIPEYHAVAEYSERKTDPMFSLRVD